MLKSDRAKLAFAVFLDILDFTIGRVIGFGMVSDLIFAGIAFWIWGPAGLFALWELADPSEQVDGFVPTMTLIALSQMGKNKEAPSINQDSGHGGGDGGDDEATGSAKTVSDNADRRNAVPR